MKKSLLIGSGVFLTLGLSLIVVAHASLAPAPAPCATVGTPFVTLTQRITNDPDSGNYGDWATDAFTEQVNVWMGTDGKTYCANANTVDGTFVTTGPRSPEKGTPLAAGIMGTFTGGENYTIPSSEVLSPDYSTSTPKSVTLPDSSVAGFSWWVNNVFPSIATSSGADYTNTYSLTYVTPHDGTWTDADSVSGGDTGDIGPVVDTNTGTGYSTIQEAVNAASPGDTIAVSAGTYPETVSIAKPLTLDGAQAGVDARGRSGSESVVDGTITIATSSVAVDGFSLDDPVGGDLITIGQSSDVTVKNNIIDNKGYVATFSGNNITFTQNAVTNDNPTSGIEANSDPGSTYNVSDNSFTGAVPTADFTVIGDPSPITSNVIVDGNSDNSGNTLVALFHTNTASISDNTVTSTALSENSAIYIGGDVNNVTVAGNTISGVTTGVKVANSFGDGPNSDVAVNKNVLRGNVFGLRVASDSVSNADMVTATAMALRTMQRLASRMT